MEINRIEVISAVVSEMIARKDGRKRTFIFSARRRRQGLLHCAEVLTQSLRR